MKRQKTYSALFLNSTFLLECQTPLNGIKSKNGYNLDMRSGILLLLMLVSFTACKTSSHRYELGLKMETTTLSNGLDVIVVEDHTVPIVSYQTWYRVGSVNERFGITGLSHLFEHLMFKGTPKYGPRKFFELLEFYLHSEFSNIHILRKYLDTL